MFIGDDWLTKTMMINTISRNEKLRSQMDATLNSDNLFSTILNQLLIQQEQQNQKTIEAAPIMNKLPSMDSIELRHISQNDSLRYEPVSPEKLNHQLKGKLAGMGEAFVQAGQRYNINPALLAAIAIHETGNGKSRAAIVKNNVAGMMGPNGLKHYQSVEDSIMDMARNLSKNYLDKGLTTISKIGGKYAPIGAKNDPTGLNNHWVSGVNRYFNQFKV
ncbi:glucosaminidase domain-containing protein [Neobacillus thermocopriae]